MGKYENKEELKKGKDWNLRIRERNIWFEEDGNKKYEF